MAKYTICTSVPCPASTPVFPSASQPPRPLFNTRATFRRGRLAWLLKPGLWEQPALMSSEDSASFSLCDAGQVPWPLRAHVTPPALWFHGVVETGESSLRGVSNGASCVVSVLRRISPRGYSPRSSPVVPSPFPSVSLQLETGQSPSAATSGHQGGCWEAGRPFLLPGRPGGGGPGRGPGRAPLPGPETISHLHCVPGEW
ncbi:hypothetical protein HJG60_009384 [Phyllostomus discolor]|uniref:Uncharacterized protein n=1 Tax=Phyllostomus discolor TaxID=89673 RepID=A0A834DCG3_9CHIR|nr:hypothetical protein HJG60_009384 [Phyllostomus discolor]